MAGHAMAHPDLSGAPRLTRGVAALSPGYFAFVMASGIISVALQLQGRELLSHAFLVTGVVGYVVLLVLTVLRAVAFGNLLLAAFRDPKRTFWFCPSFAAT